MIRFIISICSLFGFSLILLVLAENRFERKSIPECLISQHTQRNVYATTAIQCSFQCEENCDMFIPDLTNQNCHLYRLTATPQDCSSNSGYREAFIRPEHFSKIEPYFPNNRTTETPPTTTPEPTTPLYETEPTYLPNGDRCYRYASKGYVYHEKTLYYNHADHYCGFFGWHMTKVYDATHNQWLLDRNKVNYGVVEVFMGATDIAVDGTWLHSDGTIQNYTNWASGQPDGGSNEDCAIIAGDGSWHDRSCSVLRHFVCESDSSTCETAPPSQTFSWILKDMKTGDKCGRFGDKGYVFHPAAMKYDDAQKYCNALGMSLTKVHSNVHNSYLGVTSQRVKTGYWWIGVQDKMLNNTFVYYDGSPLNINPWSPGEPSGDGDCVTMGIHAQKEYWLDYPCSGLLNAICEAATTDCQFTPVDNELVYYLMPKGDRCGQFEGKSYVFHKDTIKTIVKAEEYCQGLGGNVTTINGPELDNWLREMIKIVQNGYLWLFKFDSNYTNWYPGQPDVAGCALLGAVPDAKWFDEACTTPYRFICEVNRPDCSYELVDKSPFTFDVKSGDQCGLYGGKSYLFHHSFTLNFDDAQDYCSQLGMTLTPIHNEAHNKWLASLSKEIATGHWYVGIHDRTTENSFVYMDGSPITYSQRVIPYHDPEDCILLGIHAQPETWEDIACGIKSKFICESDTTDCSFEIPDKSRVTKVLESGDRCGRYNNRGYLFHAENMNYYHAAMYCWSYGMNLTKVYSEDHKMWLYSHTLVISTTGLNWWYIGLLNVKRDGSGIYVYQDGTSPNYTSWVGGQPTKGTEYGVVMGINAQGEYYDELTSRMTNVICETPNPECV